jgi:hypothetical protein
MGVVAATRDMIGIAFGFLEIGVFCRMYVADLGLTQQ